MYCPCVDLRFFFKKHSTTLEIVACIWISIYVCMYCPCVDLRLFFFKKHSTNTESKYNDLETHPITLKHLQELKEADKSTWSNDCSICRIYGSNISKCLEPWSFIVKVICFISWVSNFPSTADSVEFTL